MNEDKQAICKALLPVLQKTRNLHDLVDLDYYKDNAEEIVIARFNYGVTKTVNVAIDSGAAMILDIVRWLM